MPIVVADRVKESSLTNGTGIITLNGELSGFQSFANVFSDGDQTYYCIENNVGGTYRWEVGLGTYTAGTLARDTIFDSDSGPGVRANLNGGSTVFCTYPASGAMFSNEDGEFVGLFSFEDLLVSGSITHQPYNNQGITFVRENASNFFHAYVDNINDRTIALHSDGSESPTWRLGLKTDSTDFTQAPQHGYVYGLDGEVGLVASTNNDVSISNIDGFVVTHQAGDVFKTSSLTGVHVDSIATAFPALTVNGGALLSANIQEWATSAGTVLSAVDKDGNFAVGKTNALYEIDVNGSGKFGQIYLTTGVIFPDGTVQNTAAAGGFDYGPDILNNTASGLAISGVFRYDVDNNTGNITVNTSNILANSASGVAISGWAAYDISTNATNIATNAANIAFNDIDIATNSASGVAISGWAENTFLEVESDTLQTVTDRGAVTTNTITAPSAVLNVLDMEPVDEANYPAYEEGRLWYDAENHTMSLYNEESDVTLQLGMEAYIRVRNATGSTILNGKVVRISGSTGAVPQVSLADQTGEIESDIVGIATHDIENNSFGYVTIHGMLRGLDTSAFSQGDELFLGTNGGLTNVVPTFPNFKAEVAHCVVSHPSNGEIYVHVGVHKLGGGDIKGASVIIESGIPFVSSLVANHDDAAVLSTDTLFAYDSTNEQLILGGVSGVSFSDGSEQFTSSSGLLPWIEDNTASGLAISGVFRYDIENLSGSGLTYDNGNYHVSSLGGSGSLEGLIVEKAVKSKIRTEPDAATITYDLNDSNTFMTTLNDNRNLATANAASGQKFMIRLRQDGTTGNRTVTWFNTISWAEGGTAPTLTTTAGKADLFGFLCTSGVSAPGGPYFDGFVIGQDI